MGAHMAASTQESASPAERVPDADSGAATVDPRAPRLGNALTATGLLGGVAVTHPAPVAAVAAVLGAAVLSGWRFDLYAVLCRRVALPVVGPTDEREAAAPHRFAKLMGAVGASLATVLAVGGFALAGYAVAAAVGLAATLSATTGFCIGCRLYRQVSLFRRLGVV